MEYNIKEHGDFKRYYDKSTKRHIWVLGYFGGGSINVSDAMHVAKLYAEENNVDLSSVNIDEIGKSRRFKFFKYVYSTQPQELSSEVIGENAMDNVWNWLND